MLRVTMIPIAHRRGNIGDCRPGKPPAPAACPRKDKASAQGERHDDRLVRAAQPVAGWRCFRCIHIRALQRSSPPRRPPPARRRPPRAPLPPGSPLIGRPADNEAAAKLAPVAPPPIAAAPDKLPIAKLKVPPGFNIEVYAAGMANARSLAEGDKGTVFVGSRLVGNVYAVTNKDGKRSVKTIASGLHRPNGIAFKNGTLYIAELSKVSKVDKIEDNLDSPKLTMIYDDLPKDEAHGWKFIGIGPDNKLYVPVGQPGNNVLNSDAHGQIRRMNLDGSGAEVIARGVRQTVGFDWHPETKQLYFTDNGRDWMSEDVPEDELNRITKVGEHFGTPYCLQGNIVDPEFGWGKSCSDYTAPVGLLGPHSAALGMRFYTGNMFPKAYKNAIIVGPPRLVEPDQEGWRRRRARQAEQGRHHEVHGAVHYRLPGKQQLYRPSRRCDADEGRLAAGLRRLERRGLSRHLRQAEGRREVRAARASRCPGWRVSTRPGMSELLGSMLRSPRNDGSESRCVKQ